MRQRGEVRLAGIEDDHTALIPTAEGDCLGYLEEKEDERANLATRFGEQRDIFATSSTTEVHLVH